MLSYFRLNDPYRMILILGMVLAFKIPLMVTSDYVTIPEINWSVLGDRLASGHKMYVEFYDDLAPLSALVYKLFDFVFGRSYTAYHIAGIILLFYQAFYFNIMLLRAKTFKENTYIPALIFTILSFSSFDIIVLSPALMGLTLVLFALRNLFNHIETRTKTDINLLYTGMFLGTAILFHVQYIILIAVVLLSLLLFTNTIPRRYLLFVYGSSIPFILAILYYNWFESLGKFYDLFVLSIFRFDYPRYDSHLELILLFVIPALFTIAAMLKVFRTPSFTNYQARIQGIFTLMMFFLFVSWMLWGHKSGHEFIILFPGAAFFLSHYFMLFKKRLWQELYFLLFLGGIIVNTLALNNGWFGYDQIVQFENIKVKKGPVVGLSKESKILLIGNDPAYFYEAGCGTPYYKWHLSQQVFTDIADYGNMQNLFENLNAGMPDVIIDQMGLWPHLIKYLPILEDNYRLESSTGYYRLKK